MSGSARSIRAALLKRIDAFLAASMGLMQTTVLVNNRRPQSDTKLEVDVLEDIVLFLGRMSVV